MHFSQRPQFRSAESGKLHTRRFRSTAGQARMARIFSAREASAPSCSMAKRAVLKSGSFSGVEAYGSTRP